MSETAHLDTAEAVDAAAAQAAAESSFNPAAGIAGAAAFADAETREILNLLGDDADGGSCCGGGCCS